MCEIDVSLAESSRTFSIRGRSLHSSDGRGGRAGRSPASREGKCTFEDG